MWDRTNPASLKGAGEFRARSREEDLRRHFHAEELGCLNAVMEQLGPLYSNCHVWMRKIKESFDPQNVANPML
jgi:predicted secreted protein